jgi:ABC-type taurine transport system ATPase subunit
MRLRASNLTVIFEPPQGSVRAVSNLVFETRKQGYLSLVGPSGCGKTTLLCMLSYWGILVTCILSLIFHKGFTRPEDRLIPWGNKNRAPLPSGGLYAARG